MCRRSWMRRPVMPAALVSARHGFLDLDDGGRCRRGWGTRTCRLRAACRPARSRISLSSCRAGALNGTSWYSFCLVELGGFRPRARGEVESAQRMLPALRHVARPSAATAGRRRPPAGRGARPVPSPAAPARRSTGSAGGGARCCVSMPLHGLSVTHAPADRRG